jgi:hypothetical protein
MNSLCYDVFVIFQNIGLMGYLSGGGVSITLKSRNPVIDICRLLE